MDEIEKFFARKEFRLKVLELTGLSFQDFFTKIMKYSKDGFESVKPWGKLGDRKNDGFVKSKGEYYQVYSPEDPSKNIKTTTNKLNSDFKGLYDYWEDKYKIKEYYFVFNSDNTNPPLEGELSRLAKLYPSIRFDILLRNNLEEIFIALPKDKIQMIIGSIPSPDELLKDIDLSLLPKIVKHILNLKFDNSDTKTKNIAPNYDEKIKFNHLNNAKHYLNNAYFQISKVNEIFAENPEEKELLKQKFVRLYNEAYTKFPSDEELQFQYILTESSPNDTLIVRNAVISLMAIYFESCDIFKEPLK